MISSKRWPEQAAAAIAGRLDAVSAEAVSELAVRVPEYHRALAAAGEEALAVCQGTLGLLLAGVRDPAAVTAGGSAVRRVASARAEAGVPLDTLLESTSLQRDLLARHLEAEARAEHAESELRVAERRLEQATTALTNALTQGYMDAIRDRGLRQRATAEALVRVTAAVNRSLDLNDVAQAALGAVKETLDVDAALLWLPVEGGEEMALTYTAGLRWNEDAHLRAADRRATFGLLELALRAGRAVDGTLASAGRPVLRSALAVALRSRGEVLGVLVAGSRGERRFDRSELDFATAASDHLAAALVRAQQHRRDARTDHLTGLANRGEFDRQLDRAVAGSRRHQRALALALLDLDGLKEINDLHGHPAGDQALEAVARALTQGVRVTDTCARIGGDEFAVAMPDTTEAQAIEVMRRVGESIRRAGLDVSVGVAAWAPGMSARQLLKRADVRLYRDKRRHHSERAPAD